MTIRVVGHGLYLYPLRTRFPFRYGIAAMTEVPHLILQLDVEVDGQPHIGFSAENLVPKWFTKDPDTSAEHDTQQMLRVVESACAAAQQAGDCASVFALWREVKLQMEQDAAGTDDPPLLWGLGLSLVERAVIDAFCRAAGMSFGDALRRNALGITLGDLYPELAGMQPAQLLPERPLDRIVVRHTVGLSDPLTEAKIPDSQRLDDGLPQSLEACISEYGLTHFKIKLRGDVEQDLDRLRGIAALLERTCSDYAFTLDANENYRAVDPLRQLWRRLSADLDLKAFLSRLIFIEQPLHREVALDRDVTRELLAWKDRPDLIIDESGGTIETLPQALAGGYVGTSHKNCKGVIKGIAAACLIRKRRLSDPGSRLVLSAEDLSITGPIALAQDVAVIAELGIIHAERNGHHYFRGLSAWPDAVQASLLLKYPDVYFSHPEGFVAVKVERGVIPIGSIKQGFGGEPDHQLRGFLTKFSKR